MGKFIVGILACMAALGIAVYFLGAHRLGITAFNVPATEHTSTFAVSWYFVLGGCIAFGIWRILKGK